MKCYCDWPDHCDGHGTLTCYGCGGDQCICLCGGETECFGCNECAGRDDYPDDEPTAPQAAETKGGDA